MTFTELTQHLSQGWKNLNKKSREQYEEKAEISRQRYKAWVSDIQNWLEVFSFKVIEYILCVFQENIQSKTIEH